MLKLTIFIFKRLTVCNSVEKVTIISETNCKRETEIQPEARAEMNRKVLVTFLKAIVLANVVQVIASDNNRPLHFHLQHYARQDSSTNAHVASKWTFLVNVMTLNSLKQFHQTENVSNGYSQTKYNCKNGDLRCNP